jgi:hypothetical protein
MDVKWQMADSSLPVVALWRMARSLRSLYGIWRMADGPFAAFTVWHAGKPSAIKRVKQADYRANVVSEVYADGLKADS